MTVLPPAHQKTTLWFLLTLAGYFALHIALRVAVSGSLDYDEAEQVLLGQWLLAGYTEQPPLYSWLQYGLFFLFGKNVFAVSLLKNGLLLLTYISVFFAARHILADDRRAVLATVSLLLIPQIGWESQRDMTHTTLVVFAAAATLWQAIRLVNNQHLINYCLLGLLLGTGILAKANFYLFAAILFLTFASFAEGRRVIFSKKILVSLFLAAAISGNYLWWMAENQDIVFSATHKFKREVGNYWLKGITSLFTNSLLFLTPLWLICLLVFPTGFYKRGDAGNGFFHRFSGRYLLFCLLVLIIVVIAGKVTYVKDRWLQPLLFVVPIFFFSRLTPSAISPSHFKFFLRIVAVSALAIYLAFTIRVVGGSFTHYFCRLNYPFATFAADMRRLGFSNGLIISDDRFIAGNLHLQFPGSTALIPEYRFENLADPAGSGHAAVVWKAGESAGLPADLAAFIESTYHVRAGDYAINFLEHPFLFSRTETVRLALLLIPLAPSPAE